MYSTQQCNKNKTHTDSDSMNLQYLLPSLQSACAGTLAHATLGTIGPQAALALGFDKNTDPHVVFVANTA